MNFEIIPDQQTPAVPNVDFTDVNTFIEEHREELDSFLSFAKTQSTAVGLASNQCSVDGTRFMLRVFALRDLSTKDWSLVIDPKITKYVGMTETKAEGCLTWKNKKIMAERNRGIEVDYFTMDGKNVTSELHYGFEGQIWQHEVNHLNGVEEVVVDYSHSDPIEEKIGRNEKCPCGSGLKYKKCCLSLK